VRVLIFSQYFPPEIGATQARMESFASGLAARGHHVEVICEVPNHPQGIVRPGYRRRASVRREADGYRVLHVWAAANPVKTTRTRLAFYGSYTAAATLAGFVSRRPDVILASSPPLPVAVAAASVAARHRVPWVMDVRDLWPEAAVALGELSNQRALTLADRLARWLYGNAAAITTVTEPFRVAIARKADPAKLTLVPNGTTSMWLDGANVTSDRVALDLPPDRFLLTYAGNLGLAQGLPSVLEAVGLLDDGFALLLLGDGPLRSQLEDKAADLGGRVIFRDQVPPRDAIRYLRASDALLVPLGADSALASFVPSKLFDFCAVGRPVILSAAGEPRRLAESSGAALTVDPENPDQLEAAVRRLQDDDVLARDLAAAGRAFAEENLRDRHFDTLEAVLTRAAGTA
jgi:glycosyltransferase involved in cell wall biosynthesis